MNEEEKKAIERCKQIIKDNNEIIKEARKNRDINSMQLTASLDNDSIAIETVLNLLEKKDRQLEERTNRIRNLEKECQSNFDNMMDTIQDNSKKDKIIDEIQKEVRDHIGFENRLKRDNREPDLFNQGRFYVANNINNILKIRSTTQMSERGK